MASKSNEDTKELICSCGRVEKLPLYVHAHWNEELIFTCPDCNTKWSILRGFITKSEEQE